ncbi:MAG: AAA family ATPase [Zavarzinella sp.]|nr:AAA family ATPase [Zavarzinella sp.]
MALGRLSGARKHYLLTSQWKTGKTTLLTGLLQGLERGESFLGRPLAPGKALVVSEESTDHWADRLRQMPVGPHVLDDFPPLPRLRDGGGSESGVSCVSPDGSRQ